MNRPQKIVECNQFVDWLHTHLTDYEKDPSPKQRMLDLCVQNIKQTYLKDNDRHYFDMWQTVFRKHLDFCILLEIERNRYAAAKTAKTFRKSEDHMSGVVAVIDSMIGQEENFYYRKDPTLLKTTFAIWYNTLKDRQTFLGEMREYLLWHIGLMTHIMIAPKNGMTDAQQIKRLKQWSAPQVAMLRFLDQIEYPETYGRFE